jgi:hypothetical protein
MTPTSLSLVLLASLLAHPALAQTLRYRCYLTTDKSEQIRFDLRNDEMRLHDQYRVTGMEPFRVKRGYAVLENKGPKGGNGKMKDRLVFVVNYRKSQVVSESTSHYYLEPELLTGGKTMRNGSKGGFVSFEGHGYSYESYVCFLARGGE